MGGLAYLKVNTDPSIGIRRTGAWRGPVKLPSSSSDSLLSINEVCLRLGLFYRKNGKTVYLRTMVDGWIKSGELKSYRVAQGQRKSKYLVHPDDLRKFLEAREFRPSRG